MSRLIVGIALVVGLWFPMAEWGLYLDDNPPALYVLVFPLLLLIASRATPPTEPAFGEGLAWLALAGGLQVIAFAGGVERFARLSIPLGVIGYLRFTGTSSLAPASLAWFAVPVPVFATTMFPLESVWRAFAEPILAGHATSFELTPWDNGLRLVALFAGLGWYADARTSRSWRSALQRSARLAMLGLPVQLGGVLLAALMSRLGGVELARVFLTHGLWIGCSVAGVVFIERRIRSEGSPA